MRRTQGRDLVLEVGQRLKTAVDRGEPEIRDLVEFAKRPENGQADLMRGDLAAAAAPDGVLDLLSQDRQLVLGDGPALARLLHAVHDLVPVERLSDPAALANRQDHALLGGEPAAARRA